jgi:serine/threonine-protein kinase
MANRIIVLAGPDEGRVFPLGTEPSLFGRSRATEGYLTDPHVSRVHCQIMPENNQYVVIDFDSGSGTFVNGKEIMDRHVLQSGDLIRIGATHLQYITEADQASPPRAVKAATEWARALVGQTIAHYRISAPLARGKTGYIFHAHDTRNETAVALKVLHSDFGQDEKKVQRFIEAMKAVMPLSHPHLLKIYGAGKSGNHCWVATEYVAGESLSAVIARIEKGRKLDWKGVTRVGIYLARALEFAHGKNLIHENVTPQNIIVGKSPQHTKLTDLMLAVATEEDPTTPISAAGLPSESLSYMSPERTDGPGASVDGRTDIYSLAATLYAMLSGKPPFQGTSVDELIEKIRLDAPQHFHAAGIHAPEQLEKLLRRSLAKRPQDRPAGAANVRQELEQIAHAHNIPL